MNQKSSRNHNLMYTNTIWCIYNSRSHKNKVATSSLAVHSTWDKIHIIIGHLRLADGKCARPCGYSLGISQFNHS